MSDYSTEHQGTSRGDPDVGATATAGDLDCGSEGEAVGNTSEDLRVSD
jgi:hypothetical protein